MKKFLAQNKPVLLSGLCLLLLTACAGNQTVRGMSPDHWKELTAEQKQLVIDESFQQDVNQTAPAHELLEQGKIGCANT